MWAELGWGVGRSRPLSRGNGGPKAWALSLLPPARVNGSPKPCDSPLSTRRSPHPSRIIFAKWEPSFDFIPPVTGVGELRGRLGHSMKQSLQRRKRLPGNEHPVTSGMEATSDRRLMGDSSATWGDETEHSSRLQGPRPGSEKCGDSSDSEPGKSGLSNSTWGFPQAQRGRKQGLPPRPPGSEDPAI